MKLIRKLGTRLNKNGTKVSWAVFWCDFCEKEVEKILGNGLKTQYCGYNNNKNNFKHGGYGTRLYKIWVGIKQRIINPNTINYKDYGGRGILVCDEWLDKNKGFINFRDWAIQNGYNELLQIDRIDNNGNYEPNNCRWVTSEINNQNQSTTKLNIEKVNEIRELYKTGNYYQKELAIKYNISNQHISDIINLKTWR